MLLLLLIIVTMTVDSFTNRPLRVIADPKVTHLPNTASSRPTLLEPYHVDLLPEYGYVQREYLISGYAEGEEYCTRLLLRCPEDPKRFSGTVIAETSHIWGGTSIWRAVNRWIMREGECGSVHIGTDLSGHAWLEIDSQAPSALGLVKASNPGRYADMSLTAGLLSKDFADTIPFDPDATKTELLERYQRFKASWWIATPQSFDILVAASQAVRSGTMELLARRVILAGLSQTGGVVRRFLTHYSHLALPCGSVPFEGLIPCASGGEALPDPPAGVKVIEVVGEGEFQSVRYPCGVSGQLLGTAHRRPDSHSFRLYEIAGMAHRESRYWSDLDKKRFAKCEIAGATWSTFPNSFIYASIFHRAIEWIGPAQKLPPPGKLLSTVGDSDNLKRDQYGNVIGGVRSLYVDVPSSRIVAATPKGRPSWYCGKSIIEGPALLIPLIGTEWMFDEERLRQAYGDVKTYRSLAGKAILRQVDDGFLLHCDAELLRRETVESVVF